MGCLADRQMHRAIQICEEDCRLRPDAYIDLIRNG